MKNSLALKLSLWICSLLTLVFFAMMGVIAYRWHSNSSAVLNEMGQAAVAEMSNRLDQTFLQYQLAAEMLAREMEERLAKGDLTVENIPDAMRSQFRAILRECPHLRGYGLAFEHRCLDADADHRAWVAFDNGKEIQVDDWCDGSVDYFHKPWFNIPMTIERAIWTRPYIAVSVEHTPIASFAAPFYKTIDGKRTPAGVIVLDLAINTLEQYLRSIEIPGGEAVNARCETFLMDSFGEITISGNKDRVMSQTIFSLCEESENPLPEEREKAQSIFEDTSGSGFLYFDQAPILAEPCELFYSKCANGWVVAAAVPQNWQRSILVPIFLRFIGYELITLAVIISLIFALTRRLHRPLVHLSQAAEKIGGGDFTSELPACPSRDEIGVLTESFRQMQANLTDYIKKLEESIVLRERTEWELNAAKRIQHDLLPHILPPFERFENIRGAASLTPARSVGGDLYDVFPINADHLAIIIGDVSGKGVPASLFMAVTQTLQRSIAQSVHEPGKLVTQLNQILSTNNESGMFVTYWLGILNIRTGHLCYTNAGHNAPILKRTDGSAEYLEERHGTPVGIMPDFIYESSELTLEVGDILTLYTDGVSEALDKDGTLFGEKRLIACASRSKQTDPKEFLAEIASAISEHTADAYQSDDITIFSIQRES